MNPLKNTDEAAEYLGLSTSFLEKARLTGDGPKFVKIGRAVRYRISALDEFASAREAASTSQKIAA
jgi:excisionase family DNA binding protein